MWPDSLPSWLNEETCDLLVDRLYQWLSSYPILDPVGGGNAQRIAFESAEAAVAHACDLQVHPGYILNLRFFRQWLRLVARREARRRLPSDSRVSPFFQGLHPFARQVLYLHYIENLCADEVALVLGSGNRDEEWGWELILRAHDELCQVLTDGGHGNQGRTFPL